MPSPCAALTSPPCATSFLTATASPRIAASATGDPFSAAADTAVGRTRTPSRYFVIRRSRSGRLDRVQIERAGAVAERAALDADQLQGRQHRVRHRRAVVRLEVQAALEPAAGVAREEQRAALVVVDV